MLPELAKNAIGGSKKNQEFQSAAAGDIYQNWVIIPQQSRIVQAKTTSNQRVKPAV